MRCTQIMHRTQRAIGFQQQIGMLSDRILIAIAVLAAAADLTDFAQQKCFSRCRRRHRMSMKWIDRRRQISMNNMPCSILIHNNNCQMYAPIRSTPFNSISTVGTKVTENVPTIQWALYVSVSLAMGCGLGLCQCSMTRCNWILFVDRTHYLSGF